MLNRDRIRTFFDHPCTNVSLMLLILVSVMLTVVELAVRFPPYLENPIVIAGDIITFIFVIELTLRYYAAPSKKKFLAAFWLDILAVLPVFRVFRVARILRLLRILRLFRAGALVNRMTFLSSAVREHLMEYMGVGIVTLIIIVFCTTALVHFDGGRTPHLGNAGEAFWWVMFSLVSGQLTERIPELMATRILALFLLLSGSAAFAIFTGLVTAVIIQKLKSSMEVYLMDISELKEHTVICGWNSRGRMIVEQLQADPLQRDRYIVVVAELCQLPDLDERVVRKEMVFLLDGDFTKVELLHKANVERAATAILLSDNTKERSDQARDALTVLAALTIEKINPSIFTIAEILNRENEAHLKMAKVEEVIISSEVSGHLLGLAALNRGLPEIVEKLLLSATKSFGLKTSPLPVGLAGRTFIDALRQVKETQNATVVCVRRGEKALFNPPGDLLLEEGDVLEMLVS